MSSTLLFDMSEKLARQIKAYRLRAEEVRTVADCTLDLRCRAALMRIAAGYDSLAGNLEESGLQAELRSESKRG